MDFPKNRSADRSAADVHTLQIKQYVSFYGNTSLI